MLEHITLIDLKIFTLFVKDYAKSFSIRQMTKKLNINYSHAFKRIKFLVNKRLLLLKKEGQVNYISLNIKNISTIQLLCFIEEQESSKLKHSTLSLLIKEIIKIDPFACFGLFGSRVSGKATKKSDWDVFVIVQEKKLKQMNKLMTKFPYVTDIQLQVFSLEEFQESLISVEETVVKHIVRNKQIIYNPHVFYNVIINWETIKYVPTQTG